MLRKSTPFGENLINLARVRLPVYEIHVENRSVNNFKLQILQKNQQFDSTDSMLTLLVGDSGNRLLVHKEM